ncbi:MAG: flagellar motor switch protein FliN [Thermoleophilales bacterium]|nr:flagellar motor switch protein FliN [Thermoleophilales bacterium]
MSELDFDPAEMLSADALLDVTLRVWAEIGRTRMPLADAVALGEGMLVELDREHDEPIELYVNGLRLGSGRLVTVEGEWALVVDEVSASAEIVERLSNAR